MIKQKNKFPESLICRYISCIILAIFHLNKNGIYHRDVKPDNMLFKILDEKEYLHINDFGIAKDIHDINRRPTRTFDDVRGTVEYMSPECFDPSI